MEQENNLLDKNDINQIMQRLYEHFSDSFFITNGKGKVIEASKNVGDHCGIQTDCLIGKTVFDIEKEGIFYPSVTAMVIKSNNQEVVIQRTKSGKTHVAVGVPVFDNKGDLYRVLSVSRDISSQIELAEEYAKMSCALITHDFSIPLPFVFCSPCMQQVVYMAKLAAETTSTVLLSGESGTGKDVIARAIHEMSCNEEKPFIKVNSVAIPESLFESELFGYSPGAFTGANKEGKVGLFEAARGGTLFLDEISELSLNQQVKLLQVLQDKSITRVGSTKSVNIDSRFISATNKNIFELVSQGKFREDLYYRLNVIPIHIPPLRERKEEIPLLIYFFLKNINSEFKREKKLSEDTIHLLMNYHWPGNVRELENLIERLVVIAEGPLIDVKSLPKHIRERPMDNSESVPTGSTISLKEAVQNVEKNTITLALQKFGSANKAAEALGINQSTVSRKIKKYNLMSG